MQARTTVHWKVNTYRELGVFGGAKVVLVRIPEMGASGGGGAMLTVNEAIEELRPTATILVGIAFGLKPEYQKLGDVLCATAVVDYELQRLGTGAAGGLEVVDRGPQAPTSPRLVGRLQDAASEAEGVRFGQMLSGDKLIDNVEFRDKLAARYPDAIGGDMEAVGLAAVGVRLRIDWILIKGICDWADGEKARKQGGPSAAGCRTSRAVCSCRDRARRRRSLDERAPG